MTVTERAPLSRERLAAAALDLVDRDGLEALSMRKLGAHLGVEAMSLYNHVDNKEELLADVADLLYATIRDTYGTPVGGWRNKARQMAAAYVHVAEAHPLALPLLIERRGDTPCQLEFINDVVSLFDEVTDDLRVAALAFSAVSAYVVGTLVQEHQSPAGAPRDDRPEGHEAVGRFRATLRKVSVQERFSDGLEAVLDGLETRYFS